MKRTMIVLFIGLLGSAIACVSVWAQATAQISGTVKDQSGAVLPGVEVTATQTETGISRSTVTNETGSFVLPNIVVGPYRLEAALPGFRTYIQTGIVLQVNSSAVINPVLEVGQVSEQVEVQANAVQVETRSTAVGQVIENERILELPLNGRQVTDLVTLSGAAVQTATGNQVSTQSMQGGTQFSIAGGLVFGVGYTLDGAMHTDPYEGANHPMPFPDALQEFRVEASGMAANAGMRSGGAVNAVTKSGTNEFHGDLFEFVRNYKFNARNFFAAKRDSLKRNQYGGTLGGPLVRNKLFFFGGYQGTRTRSDQVGETTRFVPTAATLAGDWTAFTSPACNAGRQIALRAPFANNRIDPAQYSRAAMNIAAKLPRIDDPCGKITYGFLGRPNEYQAVGKADYQLSNNHSLFGRYLATAYKMEPPFHYQKDNVLTTTNAGFDNLAQSYALGSTYLISPNTVNAFRLTVNRTAIHRRHEPNFQASDVGVKAYSVLKDVMLVAVTGGFNLGNGSNTEGTFRTTTYALNDDLNLIRGNHQFTLGGNYAYWQINQYAHVRDPGTYSFTGTATGLGMADFLTGRLTTLVQGTQVEWGSREWYRSAYVTDSWKATPRLTLNYGLRWEPFNPLHLKFGAIYGFSLDRYAQGVRSTVFPTGPAGLYYPGDPGFPTTGAAINNRWLNFAPRVGFAWDVTGDGRTSLRASFGISTDFTAGRQLGSSADAPPYALIANVTAPAGGLDDPYRDYPGGNPFPYEVGHGTVPKFTPLSQFIPMLRYNMHPPYVQSWTLSLQRQLPGDSFVSASYIGSESVHMWAEKQLNPAVFIPGVGDAGGNCFLNGRAVFRVTAGAACSTTGNTDQRRTLMLQNPVEGQYYGVVNAHEDGGTGNYNGLLLSFQSRAIHGLNLGGNYTWSHCIGPYQSFSTNANGSYVDANDRNRDQGNCPAADRRQILNLTAVASTPRFANPALRSVLSGWRVSGIFRRSTGSWLTILSGQDRYLSGDSGAQRASQILGSPYGDRSSLTKYLNPSAFVQPDLGTIGNMRPANVEGPGSWRLDTAVTRTFQVRENQKLEFRGEAFNLTNSLISGNPTTSLSSNTFGQILTSGDARIMQFALKYSF